MSLFLALVSMAILLTPLKLIHPISICPPLSFLWFSLYRTPFSVPISVSPLSSLISNHKPVFHLLFGLLTPTPFGIRYQTHSPNGAVSCLKLLPLSLCLGVLPSGPTEYLLRLCTTCETNHADTSLFSLMFFLHVDCKLDLIVVNCP